MSHEIPDDDLPLDLERLVEDAVRVALKEQKPGPFLSWMRSHIYDYSTLTGDGNGDLFDQQAAEHNDLLRALGMVLGRSLWNAIPLPSNRFRPDPMPLPGRNDPCICGSGRKYKQCCAQLPPMPTPDQNDLWPLVLELLTPQQREVAYRTKRVPVEMLAMKAHDLMEEGHPGKGRKLLEPLFEPELSGDGEVYDFALNMLCNMYDALGFNQKKEQLLQRIIAEAHRSPLRSGAWQRLSANRMDKGDAEGAWAAFQQAQRDDPGTTALGVLEIQLLLAQSRAAEARDRARMWLRKMRRSDLQDDTLIEFFEAVASDPHAAMAEIGMEMSGGAGEQVETLIGDIVQRPLPAYRLDTLTEDALGRYCALRGPDGLEALEAEWEEVFPRLSLVAVAGALASVSDASPWIPETEALWTDWLRQAEAAFDSLAILDDITSAVLEHPQANIPGWDEHMVQPLLERQCAIVDQALGDSAVLLSPAEPENEPALRALMRRLEMASRHGDGATLERLANLLLRLDGNDEQGVRLLLMDELLRGGRFDEALALADEYPDDEEPDLPFGVALARYRQGDKSGADQALTEAMTSFPRVVPMLLKKSPKVPWSDDESGPGSEVQAWYYRESALDLWQATNGAMKWLKQAQKGR